MTRKFIQRIALVAIISAGAVASAQDNTVTQELQVNVSESIDLALDSAFTNDVDAQQNLAALVDAAALFTTVLHVRSTDTFKVTATPDTAAAKTGSENKLWEYTAGAYVSSGRSINAIPTFTTTAVSGTTGSVVANAPLQVTGTDIYTGNAAATDGQVRVDVRVTPPAGTARLPDGSTYRIEITYTATSTQV